MTEPQAPQTEQRFYVRPQHNPKSRADRFKRVHYYVSRLGVTVSSRLKQTLLGIRQVAPKIQDERLRALATKPYLEPEFLQAVKELLCIMVHLDAADQGGEQMPAWLMTYLKLSLYASDYLISSPEAMDVMDLHADCPNLDVICSESALKACEYLGFGMDSPSFAPAIKAILVESRPYRQPILRDSLTLPLGQLD